MLLFSTILKLNDTLTKDAFVRLVLQWNDTSKYKENMVSGIDWQGEYNVKYGTANLSLEFVDAPELHIMEVRHEKITEDAVAWDTDFIVNFEEGYISIILDRTYREDAPVMNGVFSTPHFITLLIGGGYLADDGNLPVLRTPTVITDEDALLVSDVVERRREYALPVIYVSGASDGREVLDTGWLASRLKGAAHVLVEKDPKSCAECRRICRETGEEYGAVRIYYPSGGMPRKRFLYRSAHGDGRLRLEKVIQTIIRYWNVQRVDILYTWQGVNNAILNGSLKQQIAKCQEAESARRNAENEVDQLYEAFDEELRKMQEKLEALTKANETLMLENSILLAKLNGTTASPVVYHGDEEDFYLDEIKDMILGALDEALTNTEERTRRADILEDILENNRYQHLGEKRKQKIKSMFKGYKHLSNEMKQELSELGMTVTEEGKHYKLTYRDDPRYMVTIGKTPSDNRAGNNSAALINKVMM